MKTRTQPNIIPLCDILLVLMIIFMVISPLTPSGIDAILPEGTGRPVSPLVLNIDNQGQITFNGEAQSSLKELYKKLAKILSDRHFRLVYVQASSELPYQQVITVIDSLKAIGADRICLY